MTPWSLAAVAASILMLFAAPAVAAEEAPFDAGFAAAQARIPAATHTLAAREAQRRLGPNEALLLISPVGDDVEIHAVSPSQVAVSRLQGRRGEIRRRIEALLCQVDETKCGRREAELDVDAPFDVRGARALYQDLVAPLEPVLRDADHLFIVAAGRAAALPIGLLAVTPAEVHDVVWLADRYALTTLPSVAHLRDHDADSPPPAAGAGPAFVGFGASQWPAQASVGAGIDAAAGSPRPPMLRAELVPLAQASVELRALARTLQAPAASVRLGDAATEAAVRTAPDVSRAQVLAFATHGLAAGEIEGVDEPALVLTPASDEDDGLLTASEIARLRLTADWVILSACNTAAEDQGESLPSLATAFLAAGAKSLLASHWRVFDESAAALTVETLAAREARPGLSKAEALRAAMRAVRTGRRADGSALPRWTPAWSHPAHWAAFVLISGG